MGNTIKIKRGNKINLASAGVVDGELKYTKDTKELFIGTGEENVKIGGDPLDFPISTATQGALDAINAKIPSEASSSNQLADKEWVNVNGGKIDTLSVNGVNIPADANKNVDLPDYPHVAPETTKTLYERWITLPIVARISGSEIWSDGNKIYYSSSGYNYEFDRLSKTWTQKTWYGLTDFYGQDVWTDGTNIYYSHDTTHYVLDKTTSTWSTTTWPGHLTSFNGRYIWSDGEKIYFSAGISAEYELLEVSQGQKIWSIKSWNTPVVGDNIWTDGDYTYWSEGSSQYKLNKATGNWEVKTWKGLTSFDGKNVWSEGNNLYYSYQNTQYILDRTSSTWSQKSWTGITSFNGTDVWTDGKETYISPDMFKYMLVKTPINPVINQADEESYLFGLKLDKEKIGLIELNASSGTLTNEQYEEALKEICFISDSDGNLYYKYSVDSSSIIFISINTYVSAVTNVETVFKRISITKSSKVYVVEAGSIGLSIYTINQVDTLLIEYGKAGTYTSTTPSVNSTSSNGGQTASGTATVTYDKVDSATGSTGSSTTEDTSEESAHTIEGASFTFNGTTATISMSSDYTPSGTITGSQTVSAHSHTVNASTSSIIYVSGVKETGGTTDVVTGYGSFDGGSASLSGNYGFSATVSNIMYSPTVVNGVLSWSIISADSQSSLSFTPASLGAPSTASVILATGLTTSSATFMTGATLDTAGEVEISGANFGFSGTSATISMSTSYQPEGTLSGSVTVPAHSHTYVPLPSHTHSIGSTSTTITGTAEVSVASHTHDLGNHTHNTTITN